jgi:hypothetical protein
VTDEAVDVGRAARSVAHSDGLRNLARVGFAGYGLLHLLVAWLALQLAWGLRGPGGGTDGRTTDQAGALATLTRSPGGQVLVWLLVAGLAGLCLWQAVEVLRHHGHLPPPGRERRDALVQLAKTVSTAVLYGYLAVAATRTALGSGKDRSQEQQTVRGVLGWPGGQLLVVAVGAVVVVIGGYLVQKGWRHGYRDELDLRRLPRSLRSAADRASQVGFVLKGVALVLVGVVVAWAALTFDPQRATGMDGALRTVAGTAAGPWVLTAIAAGLAAFAVYCGVRAVRPVG